VSVSWSTSQSVLQVAFRVAARFHATVAHDSGRRDQHAHSRVSGAKIADFYEVINDAGQVEREFERHCLKG
jgi:hypothetical protein